jgi:hypothetical protein
MVTRTKLTGKGSSTVRKLSGTEAAALQRRGSSGDRRRGPSSPAAGGVEGRMCGEVPMGDSGGTGGAHRGEWVGGDAAARNLAATLRPEIWRLEASPMGRTGRKVEGRKGGVRAAEGK